MYQNLKNHNVRNDLKKLADIGNDTSCPKEEMPRYTLSANQSWFDTLFNLLDRNDDTSADVWDLVRMLNTNKQIFTQILTLQSDGAGDQIDWSKVFEDSSIYK